jgi:NhaP-type Na+/H+ and K+/H+ antiporter
MMLNHEHAIIYVTPLLALVYIIFFGCLETRLVIYEYGELHRVQLHKLGLCLIPILIGVGLATLASMPLAWSSQDSSYN